MQSGRVLKALLPGLGLRASILTKATAAGTEFGKAGDHACLGGGCSGGLRQVATFLLGWRGKLLEEQKPRRVHLLPNMLYAAAGWGVRALLVRLLPYAAPMLAALCCAALQVDILLAAPLMLGRMAAEGKIDLTQVRCAGWLRSCRLGSKRAGLGWLCRACWP